MSRYRRLLPWPASRLVVVLALVAWLVAVTATAAALVRTGGLPLTTTEVQVLVTYFLAVVVGELNRITLPGQRESAPMAVAAGYGLAMTTSVLHRDVRFGSSLVLATVGLAMVLTTATQNARGVAPRASEVASRFLGVVVASLLFRTVMLADGAEWVALRRVWESQRWILAVVMVLVSAVALGTQSLVTSVVDHLDNDVPWRGAVRDELRQVGGLSAALAASGALIALAEDALGVWAIPVFLLPLVLTQFALRRYAGIRETYRQTIRTLSRLTEVGGYTQPDHPTRVAHLSVDMARVLGVPSREASSVEYAALLHDIGQLALRRPIPAGSTTMAAPADQDRIAQDGAEIVRTTGVLADVADVLEVQAKPYRHVRELGENIPLAARIIKVANAYDDLAGPAPTRAAAAAALERIHLGLGYEYDPAVVEALERVLEQRRASESGSLGHERWAARA